MITLTLPFRSSCRSTLSPEDIRLSCIRTYGKRKRTVHAPIGRDPKNRLRNAINYDHGKPAVTHYKVIERFRKFTWIEAKAGDGEDTSDPCSYGICQASAFRRQSVRSVLPIKKARHGRCCMRGSWGFSIPRPANTWSLKVLFRKILRRC